jgi:hypothetical protein
MPTFRKVEIVDARKFEGGAQNGTNLVFWVNEKEGHALWVEAKPIAFSASRSVFPEHIRVYDHPYSQDFDVAYVGDWIMQNQDGTFKVVRQQQLDSEYEEV